MARRKIQELATKANALPKDFNKFEVCLKEYEENTLEEIDNFDFESFEGNLAVYISNNFFPTCEYLKERKQQELTQEDYEIGFNYFYNILKRINEKTVYNATTYTFAQFMGIAELTLKRHADQNNGRGNTVRIILDKLKENHIQTMQGDRINPVTGIFLAKAVHGLRDTEAPNLNILNINSSAKSVDDIMLEYSKYSKN